MTDFNKILDKAKELEAKMKQSQENIKKIRVEGVSGSNSVKVVLDGDGEMLKIEVSDEILRSKRRDWHVNTQPSRSRIKPYTRIDRWQASAVW